MKKRKEKRIPFDVNVALRIKNGLIKGYFVKRNGDAVVWLTDNVLTPETWNKVRGKQLFYCERNNFISYFETDLNGHFASREVKNDNDVFIVIREEDFFEPKMFHSCVVRNGDDDVWRISAKTGCMPFVGRNLFYVDVVDEGTFVQIPVNQCLPLNEETVKLVGTKVPYKE